MGMFDEIRVNFQLPGLKKPPPYIVQTKGLECRLDQYTIDENGRLILTTWEWEQTPKDELPYPDIPFIGCMRKVEGSKKEEDVCHHGCIDCCEQDEDKTLHGFEFKFTDGKLVGVTKIED